MEQHPKKINENDKLRNILQEIEIEGIEDINFSKQNENTIIIHNKSLNSNLFIRLTREEKKAILTEEDDVLYEFVVRGKFRMSVYSADPKLSLGSIKAVYRSLRDNYEYRMRYDESSQFFIREMELKRKYSEKDSASGSVVIQNGKFRRNLSITGLYYHLFRYGESLSRIALTIALFFSLTTLFWVILSPSSLIPKTLSDQENLATTIVINATERTLSDMFQFRSQDLEPMDYFIRISSLVLLGVIIIALKRKFERRARH